MNSYIECEQINIKYETDFMSVDEMKTDIKIEPVPISEHVPSVKIISEVRKCLLF